MTHEEAARNALRHLRSNQGGDPALSAIGYGLLALYELGKERMPTLLEAEDLDDYNPYRGDYTQARGVVGGTEPAEDVIRRIRGGE